MSKKRDSKSESGSFVQLFEEAVASSVPAKFHVVPTAEWYRPVYGEMEITPADILQ